MAKQTVLFAGGGTAGHVNPLLATVTAFKAVAPEFDRLVLGTAQGLEADLVPAAGERLETIEKLPFPRRPSPQLFTLPVKMRRTVAGLRELMRHENVRAVVGFGGYVSTPAYLAARSEKIPVLIHEQNARPGLANKLGARFASVVALTFAQTELAARRGQTLTLGLPLRPAIVGAAQALAYPERARQLRVEAANFFDLDPDLPVVLVTGGSLGAVRLNETVPPALSALPTPVQVIHLTGKGKSVGVRQFVDNKKIDNYRVLEYLTQMEQAMALADVVICRAGAATVSENCALGLPAIYIPLAIGNGEQARNAAQAVKTGAARLILERDLNQQALHEHIIPWLDPKARQVASQQARKLANLEAASQFAALIKEEARG